MLEKISKDDKKSALRPHRYGVMLSGIRLQTSMSACCLFVLFLTKLCSCHALCDVVCVSPHRHSLSQRGYCTIQYSLLAAV
jgi:hypothetical protein